MNNTIKLLLLFSIIFINCSKEPLEPILKNHPSDPFLTTMTASQFFSINPKEDNVIEGKEGTVIVFPKGCFENVNEKTIADNVEIELSESLSIEEMLLSNLTTTSNGIPLETDGMIYINAKSNGDQLKIKKDNPIYIEIPTNKKKPNMNIYKGMRDEAGNMDWVEPKELENYLIPIDIFSLDFLPEGFATEVHANMPIGDFKTADTDFVDSLYYSFSPSFLMEQEFTNPSISSNKNKHNHDSHSNEDVAFSCPDLIASDSIDFAFIINGINPTIIKTIKDKKFQNTLLSTREFEERLRIIHQTCCRDFIELYLNNLDKNLWEIDLMAADLKKEYNDVFMAFSKKKYSKIQGSNIQVEILKAYYEKRLKRIQTELNATRNEAVKEKENQKKIAKETKKEYKKLLEKRNDYRKETYGFERTEMGWINIDKGTGEKNWAPMELEILVKDAKEYDRVYSYLIYTSIRNLYKLNTNNNEIFHTGENGEKTANMPKNKLAISVTVGYKNKTTFFKAKEFKTGTIQNLSIDLEESNIDDIKNNLKKYDEYNPENSIVEDLKYMDKFSHEKKRLVKEEEMKILMMRLFTKVFPCIEELRREELGEGQ